MLHIVKKLLNKLNKLKTKEKIVLVVGIVICSLVVHYILNKTGLRHVLRLLRLSRLIEKFVSEDTFVFFSMDGCGHCNNVKKSGEFEALKKKCEAEGSKCPCKCIIDSGDHTEFATEREKVDGFPLFKLFKADGTNETYPMDGKRTESAFTAFLKKYIN